MKVLDYSDLVKKVNNSLPSEDGAFANIDWFEMEEVNAWTYWQGRGNRNPKIMLIGQDWGALTEKNQKYFKAFDSVVEDSDLDINVHYFDCVEKIFPTDKNLCQLFDALGYPHIDRKRYKELFFTNLIPGYRTNLKSSGGFNKAWINEIVVSEFKELINCFQPQIVICLGRVVYDSVIDMYDLPKPKISKWTDYLNDFYGKDPAHQIEPLKISSTYIFPVAHPGSYGVRARSLSQQVKDWTRIREFVNDSERK